MDHRQYLLSKLAEEAAEVAQIALKTQQFGFLEKYPKSAFTNLERVHHELDDLMAIVEMLNELGFGYEQSDERKEAKKAKVLHYHKYSIALGMTNEKTEPINIYASYLYLKAMDYGWEVPAEGKQFDPGAWLKYWSDMDAREGKYPEPPK